MLKITSSILSEELGSPVDKIRKSKKLHGLDPVSIKRSLYSKGRRERKSLIIRYLGVGGDFWVFFLNLLG